MQCSNDARLHYAQGLGFTCASLNALVREVMVATEGRWVALFPPTACSLDFPTPIAEINRIGANARHGTRGIGNAVAQEGSFWKRAGASSADLAAVAAARSMLLAA